MELGISWKYYYQVLVGSDFLQLLIKITTLDMFILKWQV